MNIGIVGRGFVGNAVYEKFSEKYYVLSYDINPELSHTKTLEELVKQSDMLFVCLPTPMIKNTGRCSTNIVKKTLREIHRIIHYIKFQRIAARDRTQFNPLPVVIKSTVPPGTSDSWAKDYWCLDIVFSPEFLTEANAKEDFSNQNRVILGGNPSGTDQVAEVFRKVFGDELNIVKTDRRSAEMVKYMANNFLATKVAFANEMYQLCDQMGLDYTKIKDMVVLDPRIGKSHLDVPGPDGDFGFGGHCFPKDLNALITVFMDNELDPILLKTVRDLNDKVRIHKDWLEQKNRAVV